MYRYSVFVKLSEYNKIRLVGAGEIEQYFVDLIEKIKKYYKDVFHFNFNYKWMVRK